MAGINVAKSVFFAAMAVSRSPRLRAAIKSAPNLVSEERKKAAYETTKRAARKAGELTAKVVPRNRYF